MSESAERMARLYRTVRHLRPGQLLLRPFARVGHPLRGRGPLECRRPQVAVPAEGCVKRAWFRPPTGLTLLDLDVGLVDAGWEPPGLPRLVQYNAHYFDWLFGESPASPEDQVALMRRWIERNPVGQGAGWEPYPLSLRLANWIRWFAVQQREPDAAILASIAEQASYLRRRIEWHLMGNHVLANLKALVLAGLFFEGPAADELLRFSEGAFMRQLAEQLRPDGGHGELSPMYQAILAEDVLDLVAAYGAFGQPVPAALPAASRAMIGWLSAVTHPDGGYAQFNDTALCGPAAPLAELAGYAMRLGLGVGAAEPSTPVLDASGYVRARLGDAVLIADCADVADDHLAGHAHADLLTFELSLDGERLIVDTGVSTYAVGERRSFERSTAAHNTIEIDGASSAETWAAFRTGRRGRPRDRSLEQTDGTVTIACAHDGFAHLPGSPVHRRLWEFSCHGLAIEDSVQGSGTHTLVTRLYLDPSLSVEVRGGTAALSRRGVLVAMVDASEWGAFVAQDFEYARGFNRVERGVCLCASKSCSLPFRARLTVRWAEGELP